MCANVFHWSIESSYDCSHRFPFPNWYLPVKALMLMARLNSSAISLNAIVGHVLIDQRIYRLFVIISPKIPEINPIQKNKK
jgi:hypothetical protein